MSLHYRALLTSPKTAKLSIKLFQDPNTASCQNYVENEAGETTLLQCFESSIFVSCYVNCFSSPSSVGHSAHPTLYDKYHDFGAMSFVTPNAFSWHSQNHRWKLAFDQDTASETFQLKKGRKYPLSIAIRLHFSKGSFRNNWFLAVGFGRSGLSLKSWSHANCVFEALGTVQCWWQKLGLRSKYLGV